MRLGFVKPNYPNEKRVALLPEHIVDFDNDIIIETGFGEYLDFKDQDYIDAGCQILSREEIFETCEAIFSLKLLQESDYPLIRKGQIIIGWTHPFASGANFMKLQGIPKELIVVDLDNIHPHVHFKDRKVPIDWIPKNFVSGNSFNAGYAAALHAVTAYGMIPTAETRVAILSPGNVAQGAFYAMAKLGANVRLFYRKTMTEFLDNIGDFDIIISGIEVDTPGKHIISKALLKKAKKNCLIIDAAADTGSAIEGSRSTTIDNPIYKEDGIYYYNVNNTPSILYRSSSRIVSESFSKHVYRHDVSKFMELARQIMD